MKVWTVGERTFTDKTTAELYHLVTKVHDHMSGGYGVGANFVESELDALSLDDVENSLVNSTKHWGDGGYKKGQLLSWGWR